MTELFFQFSKGSIDGMAKTCPSCDTPFPENQPFCSQCGAASSEAETVVTGETPADVGQATSHLENELSEALAPNYALVKKLGEGGMGSVFLARDQSLKRLVAVKVLSPDFAAVEDARKRFQREAESVAAITHPNVVSVYGVGKLADGTPYFVMQYVAGRNLEQVLEEDGALDSTSASKILGAVAAGLAAAHDSGIIHRDIKPANILLDETGRVLVSDFGIAALDEKQRETATKLTGVGISIGTPTYMSPEQLTAEEVTTATDVYGLGAMGFEMVAGRPPFVGNTPHELIAAKLRDPVPKLSKLERSVAPEYEDTVTRCLATEASMRPTAIDVADRLSRVVNADLKTAWLGTGLLIGIAALSYATFGAWWLIEFIETAAERMFETGERTDFWVGVRLAVNTFIAPMAGLGAGFLVLCVLSLGIHLRRLRLRHGTVAKTLKAGFAHPGALGVSSIGVGALVVFVVPLIFVFPILQRMSASVDVRLPLAMRLVIYGSDIMQNWWVRLALAVIVLLLVGLGVRKRSSPSK